MTCDIAYASGWAYAAFWCVGGLLSGVDNSGGAANAFLTDTQADFLNAGVSPNVGMILYNTTQATSGPVTVALTSRLTATGVTWDNGDAYRIATVTGPELSTIEHYLNVTAGNIHAALAASGQCDCTMASWAYDGTGSGYDFLGKLNIIEAGAFHTCQCGMPGQRMSEEERRLWLEWSNEQLTNLRTGNLDVCQGATGAEYPSWGWAAQGLTPWTSAEIIRNRVLRTIP